MNQKSVSLFPLVPLPASHFEQRPRRFFQVTSEILKPILPGFIGAGFLSGVANLIFAFHGEASTTLDSWLKLLGFLLNLLTNLLIILIAWRAAEKMGAEPIFVTLLAIPFCSLAAPLITSPFIQDQDSQGNYHYHFLGFLIEQQQLSSHWLTAGLVQPNGTLGAPRSGLLGALLMIGFTIYLDKQLTKICQHHLGLKLLIKPVIVLFIGLIIIYFFVIPFGFYFFLGLSWLFQHLYTNPWGAALLGGTYLLMVMFGIHQGFFPIYLLLMAETQINGLFPIMIMAAASQVGVGCALWKNSQPHSPLRKEILAALIPGFLGITEPLTYGITMPRLKPLFLACFGGAVGGFILGGLNYWGGIELGMVVPIGPGGLSALLLITSRPGGTLVGIGIYSALLILMYLLGFSLGIGGYSSFWRWVENRIQWQWHLYNQTLVWQKRWQQKCLFLLFLGTLIWPLVTFKHSYQQLPSTFKAHWRAVYFT